MTRRPRLLPLVGLAYATLAAPAPAALVLHYTFDNSDRIGASIRDSVGSAHATAVGAMGLGLPGVLGEAAQFPNDDGLSYIDLPAALNPSPNGSAARTFAFWFNQLEVGVENKMFGYGNSTAGRAFDISLEGGGVRLRYSGGNVTWGSGLDFVGADSGFHHLAVRVNNAAADYLDIDVLLDGQRLTSAATGGSPATTAINTGGGAATRLNLGRSPVFAASGDFIGLLDDFRIYNEALSDTAIADLAGAVGRLVYDVDPVTGAVALRNPTSSPIALDYYEIASPAGSLRTAGWATLESQNRPGFPAGAVGQWETLGDGSASLLAEGRLIGESVLAPGASARLGAPYDPTKLRDLQVTYRTGGAFRTAGLGAVAAGQPGDFNADGRVDAADYAVWRDAQGTALALANDPTPGVVNAADRTLWASHYGAPAAAAVATPEPGAAALGLGLAVALAASRRLGRRGF